MVKLLVGNKGCGKTKKLISYANEAVAKSNGNVVVIEKGAKLMYDVTHKARLIDAKQYQIQGYDMLYGFIGGICAGNYDVTDILVDSTLKICGPDLNELKVFIDKISILAEGTETDITFLISADAADLPDGIIADIEKL